VHVCLGILIPACGLPLTSSYSVYSISANVAAWSIVSAMYTATIDGISVLTVDWNL